MKETIAATGLRYKTLQQAAQCVVTCLSVPFLLRIAFLLENMTKNAAGAQTANCTATSAPSAVWKAPNL